MYWRLRRVPFFEAAIFAFRQAQVESDVQEEDSTRGPLKLDEEAEIEGADEAEAISDAEWMVRVGRILINDGIWGDAFGKLARHETSLLNKLAKTLVLLDETSENRQSRLPTLNLTALPSAA